ncbi:MAG: hypothetical protein AB7D36_02460 [Oscillospiraceae bacterium]
MAYCKNCGAYVADGFDQCPACGKGIRAGKRKSDDAWDIYEDNGIKRGTAQKQQETTADSGYYHYSNKKAERNKSDAGRAKKNEFHANEWYQSQHEDRTVYTGEVVNEDITAGRRMLAVCAYLEALILIPLFVDRDNSFVRFHINQGIALVILSVIRWVLVGTFILGIFAPLLSLVIGVLALMGIVNALQGKQKELPLIGGIKILK